MPVIHEVEVNARPTKSLFIKTLVKDLSLNRAILDLVDNSVDSARELRPNANYSGLEIRMEVSRSKFRITDNCKGIPVEEAQKYAFRFGAAPGRHAVEHSIGQFGVGMKRALFKMAKEFTVESATRTTRFTVHVDVREWTSHAREDDWTFELRENDRLPNIPAGHTGTVITASPLLEDVQPQFETRRFINSLCDELSTAHQYTLSKGLKIVVNGIQLKSEPLALKCSNLIKPAYLEFGVNGTLPKVSVAMFAGVSEFDAQTAGWYLYCNKRLVLRADQTVVTGWGERESALPRIPRYHPQFAYFRGYVYFDCDLAGRLPWNTTKTGIDIDSGLYKVTREHMVRVMRDVIDWLNALKEEKERKKSDENVYELERAINDADELELDDIKSKLRTRRGDGVRYTRFRAPSPKEIREAEKTITISYKKPLDQFKKAKGILKVASAREVGERTFDFFYGRMCKD